MCQYFLKISSTFEQYRDNTDNRDNFGHYNCDKKFSYRYIPSVCRCTLRENKTSMQGKQASNNMYICLCLSDFCTSV